VKTAIKSGLLKQILVNLVFDEGLDHQVLAWGSVSWSNLHIGSDLYKYVYVTLTYIVPDLGT
jgi:hypothetical protein